MVGQMSAILRELEQVQDRLSTLCNDSGPEKLDLMTRQEELRTQAARLADDVDSGCSTQELLTQLARLRRRRDVLHRQRGRGGSAPGMSRSGTEPLRAPQVEDRIKRIRSMLADRGISVQ